MSPRNQRISKMAAQAVLNPVLHQNLRDASKRFHELWTTGMNRLDDPAAGRQRAKEIKESCLDNLPALLQELEEKVTSRGGQVHWCADAAQAREVILGIAKRRGAKSVVKGKSMMSEEIALNHALEAAGLEVFETDLGEYIVQLGDEAPSHLLAPAIHLNRDEVGRLFADKLGVEYTSDPETLTMIAREVLREKYQSADLGITGGNFAIAETGTIALFENEGNIRYSTSLPPVHISVIGIEKVIANWEQFAWLAKMLVYAATGQVAPSYLSLISGPRREGEWDGPEEFHLILLDAGRSKIMADPKLRQSLRCMRCGACLNVCPVYQWVGGHSYGGVYSGPIGCVLNSQLMPLEQVGDLPYACTLCGACADACPVKIEHPDLLLHLRWLLAESPDWRHPGTESTAGQKAGLAAHAWLAAKPPAYRLAMAGARRAQRLARLGAGVLLPGALKKWSRSRALPEMKRPFGRRWPRLRQRLAGRKGGAL